MANTFKVIYRGATPVIDPTSASTVYTVPSATTTLVTNIVVSNSDTQVHEHILFILIT